MLKNKYIKISVVAFTVLIALWLATPKAYYSNLFQYKNNSISINANTKLQAPEASDLEEEYKKPVYFNIFKFVNNFIPKR